MEDIVDKSKKYKIYLIILGVAAIISLVISYFMYLALIQQKEAIDETYEKIVNSGDETSKEVLDELNNGLAEEEKFTKEDAIELFETLKSGEVYNLIEQDKSAEIIGPFTMSCLSLFNGYMLIVILLSKIEHKYLKGLNKVLRIILNVVAIIVIWPFSAYVAVFGSIALPIVIIYYIYKYFKYKKEISTDSEDCKNVMGTVDADEVFNTKNK